MASLNIISLDSTNFKNVTTKNILSLLVSNTHTDVVTFDLAIGPIKNANSTSTTDVVFVLKDLAIQAGSTFVWDDDGVLTNAFTTGSKVLKFDANQNKFKDLKNNTFLIRLSSAGTADVLLKRF